MGKQYRAGYTAGLQLRQPMAQPGSGGVVQTMLCHAASLLLGRDLSTGNRERENARSEWGHSERASSVEQVVQSRWSAGTVGRPTGGSTGTPFLVTMPWGHANATVPGLALSDTSVRSPVAGSTR